MATDESQVPVRHATMRDHDVDFILAAWDSTLPFLASIGAGEMWGDEPFSLRDGQRQEVIDIIQKSEKNEDDDSRRFLVVETHSSETGVVKVGAALIRDALPKFLTEHIDFQHHSIPEESLLYLEVLIADCRPQQRSEGVGLAVVHALKERARNKRKEALYVDFWTGNDRKLEQ